MPNFSLVSILTTLVLGTTMSLAVASDGVEVPVTNTPSPVIFCTREVGCDYPALPITPDVCVNFNDYLANAVRAAVVPGGYVCTVFLEPGCIYKGHSIFGQPVYVKQDIPEPFYEHTNSFRCSPF